MVEKILSKINMAVIVSNSKSWLRRTCAWSLVSMLNSCLSQITDKVSPKSTKRLLPLDVFRFTPDLVHYLAVHIIFSSWRSLAQILASRDSSQPWKKLACLLTKMKRQWAGENYLEKYFIKNHMQFEHSILCKLNIFKSLVLFALRTP